MSAAIAPTETGTPVVVLNVGTERRDLTASFTTPQLNAIHGEPDLTKVATLGGGFKLSELQRKILLAVARTDALPIRELVRKCFGKLSRTDDYLEYQTAYASVSRSVRKLKNRLLLQNVEIADIEVMLDKDNPHWFWSPRPVYSWVRITEQGIGVVKSVDPDDTFNLLPIKSIRLAELPTSRSTNIRVFVHRPDVRNEFGRWDSEKLMTVVRKEFGEDRTVG